jgi:pimeloyl-ACP methyl ester carboxylesterase
MDATEVPTLRRHGDPPRRVAVIHGGPGAPGMVTALAVELAVDGTGVLEPFQTADSIAGQVDELAGILRAEDEGPYTVVGSSWGAMLAVLTAQHAPDLFARLVLVGGAPFDEHTGATTTATRRSRMTSSLRAELDHLHRVISGPDPARAAAAFARTGDLLLGVDHLDPIVDHLEVVAHELPVFEAVWGEVVRRRDAGTLLDPATPLVCPVVVLHGDHDPHPLDGVVEPLRPLARDLTVQVIDRCGHLPWLERQARERFLTCLRAVLASPAP